MLDTLFKRFHKEKVYEVSEIRPIDLIKEYSNEEIFNRIIIYLNDRPDIIERIRLVEEDILSEEDINLLKNKDYINNTLNSLRNIEDIKFNKYLIEEHIVTFLGSDYFITITNMETYYNATEEHILLHLHDSVHYNNIMCYRLSEEILKLHKLTVISLCVLQIMFSKIYWNSIENSVSSNIELEH